MKKQTLTVAEAKAKIKEYASLLNVEIAKVAKLAGVQWNSKVKKEGVLSVLSKMEAIYNKRESLVNEIARYDGAEANITMTSKQLREKLMELQSNNEEEQPVVEQATNKKEVVNTTEAEQPTVEQATVEQATVKQTTNKKEMVNMTNENKQPTAEELLAITMQRMEEMQAAHQAQINALATQYEARIAEMEKATQAPVYAKEDLQKVVTRINAFYGAEVVTIDMPVEALKNMLAKVRQAEASTKTNKGEVQMTKHTVVVDGKEYTKEQAETLKKVTGVAKEQLKKGYDAINNVRIVTHGSLEAFAAGIEKYGHPAVDGAANLTGTLLKTAADLSRTVINTAEGLGNTVIETGRTLGHSTVDATAGIIRGGSAIVKPTEAK